MYISEKRREEEKNKNKKIIAKKINNETASDWRLTKNQLIMISTVFRQAALVIGTANALGLALTGIFQRNVLTDLVGVSCFFVTALQLSRLHDSRGLLTTIPWYDNRLLLINTSLGLWGSGLMSYLFRLSFNKDKSNEVKKRSFGLIQAMWDFTLMFPITLLNGLVLYATSTPLSAINSEAIVTVTNMLSISQSTMTLTNILYLDKIGSPFIQYLTRLFTHSIIISPFLSLFGGILVEIFADYQTEKHHSTFWGPWLHCKCTLLWCYSRE
jgi:hypothetical protein